MPYIWWRTYYVCAAQWLPMKKITQAGGLDLLIVHGSALQWRSGKPFACCMLAHGASLSDGSAEQLDIPHSAPG